MATTKASTEVAKGRTAHVDREAQLRATRARRELLAAEEAQAAVEAAGDGLTQRQIGALLGRSQSDVHRLLRRARNSEPNEARLLILRTVAGDESRGTMVGSLRPGLTRGRFPDGEQVDGYEAGVLDEVRRAFMEGFLSEDEYNEIRGAAVSRDQA